MSVEFIIDSDQQFTNIKGKAQIGIHKSDLTTSKILRACRSRKISAVISAGDLTDHGYDAKNYWCCFKNGDVNEFEGFLEHYYEPIQLTGTPLLLCAGNHDTYTNFPHRKPVFDFIKEVYGDLYYHKKIDGINYFSCHMYPTREICEWLKNEILNTNGPIIIFFHYNLQGAYSDWWQDSEKEYFWNTISPFKHRIICIINGHLHSTVIEKWKGVQYCIAGASEVISGLYNFKTGHLDLRVI